MRIFFGIERNSHEHRVGSESGAVVTSVTLRRRPITHQWQPALLRRATAFPWDSAGRRGTDGEATADVDGAVADKVEVPEQPEDDGGAGDDDGTTMRMGRA